VNVTVVTAGALTYSLPGGKVVIEGDDLTVATLLESLVARYSPGMAYELMDSGRLRDGLALLVNGRNVLSMPGQFSAPLHDGDEVFITILVAGG
jgi:molybdopterin converting factor small subunit